MYKIITNILVFHLQKSLPSLISENQGAFASGRRAIDQILIAKGMLHVIKKKERNQFFPLSLILKRHQHSILEFFA